MSDILQARAALKRHYVKRNKDIVVDVVEQFGKMALLVYAAPGLSLPDTWDGHPIIVRATVSTKE